MGETHELPHEQEQVDAQLLDYLKLMGLHRELASYYRAKSKDRRTIANLWFAIDTLEEKLTSEGIAL